MPSIQDTCDDQYPGCLRERTEHSVLLANVLESQKKMEASLEELKIQNQKIFTVWETVVKSSYIAKWIIGTVLTVMGIWIAIKTKIH